MGVSPQEYRIREEVQRHCTYKGLVIPIYYHTTQIYHRLSICFYSQEPMNISGMHCKKHCGLTSKGLGLTVADRHIVLVKKNGKARNPKKNVEQVRLSADKKTSGPKIIRSVAKYRPDLLPQFNKSLATVGKQSHSSIN